MMRQVWEETYRKARKHAREVARREFEKYPEARIVCVPYFPPMVAGNIERLAFEPVGYMIHNELVLDENNNIIHRRNYKASIREASERNRTAHNC